MLLQESLGNVNCCTTVVAHVSDSPAHLLQTLSTIQTATRIRRTLKKAKVCLSKDSFPCSCPVSFLAKSSVQLQPFHFIDLNYYDYPYM